MTYIGKTGQKSEQNLIQAMTPDDFTSMTRKMRRLEIQNRLLFAGVILSITVALVARTAKKPPEVKVEAAKVEAPKPEPPKPATELSLTDSKGTVRWRVGLASNGSVIESFFDASGKNRIMFGINDNGSPIESFFDAAEKERLFVGIDDQNTALLIFNDSNGDKRLAAYVFGANGRPGAENLAGMSVATPGQRGDISLRCLGDGTSLFTASDINSKQRFAIEVSTNGLLSQRIYDSAGQVRVGSYANGNAESGQCFLDANGKLRSVMSVDATTDSFRRELLDPSGHLRLIDATFGDGTLAESYKNSAGETAFSFSTDGSGNASHYIPESSSEADWKTADHIITAVEGVKLLYELLHSDK